MPIQTPTDSPALTNRSSSYPADWDNKVPSRVRMLATVRPDFPLNTVYRDLVALKDLEYGVWVNSHGAVSAIVGEQMLGLRPDEFEVIEWHDDPTTPRYAMIILFQCANEACGQEFSEEWPLSYTAGHFLQGRVVACPACGLRQLLHPPQPATALIMSVDGNLLHNSSRCATLMASGG